MYLILMAYACLISCSLINKFQCHSLAYFNLRWTCVVILHKYEYVRARVCMYTGYACMCVYMRVCISMHAHVCECVCVCVYVWSVRAYVRTCVCVHQYVWILWDDGFT